MTNVRYIVLTREDSAIEANKILNGSIVESYNYKKNSEDRSNNVINVRAMF